LAERVQGDGTEGGGGGGEEDEEEEVEHVEEEPDGDKSEVVEGAGEAPVEEGEEG